MLKKFLFSLVLILSFGTLFVGKAHAALDISLEDETEEKAVLVTINSNGSYVDGVDIGIIFSEDVTVTKVTPMESFCTFGGSMTFADNRVSIECFNDVNTEMNGVLATITYETESTDYSFYLDESNADLGSLTLGEVININKPVEVPTTEEVVVEDEKLIDKAITFLSENSLYVLAGVITFIALILTLVAFTSKKE